MKKTNKKFLKELKSIAGQLPEMLTDEKATVYREVSGARLQSAGIGQINGKAVKTDQMYNRDFGGVKVNHYRRMLTIYNDGGIDRVKSYMNQVFELNNVHHSLITSLQERLSKAI
jgi:hypothetical protein